MVSYYTNKKGPLKNRSLFSYLLCYESESVSYAGHNDMAIAKDTWLESVLARNKVVAAQIELYTSTKLDTTISGAFAIMGNRTSAR